MSTRADPPTPEGPGIATNPVHTSGSTWRGLVPGVAVAAVGALVATGLHGMFRVPALLAAVALGVVTANAVDLPARFTPGLHVAGRRLLRVGVVLVGFQLSVRELASIGVPGLLLVAAVVTITFVGTLRVGRALGISGPLALLVATGFSICGASAVAGMEGVADAEESEVAYAIALVTLCGSIAIFLLPVLGRLLGLHGATYGRWVGASVHDIGQVVATATPGGGAAVRAAVVVKLTRVLLLAPLVATMGGLRRRRSGPAAEAPDARRPALVPGFVLGFLAAVAVRSTGVLSTRALGDLAVLQGLVLAAALFAVGCGVQVARLRRVGGRPLLLGVIAWVLVSGSAFVGIHFLPA